MGLSPHNDHALDLAGALAQLGCVVGGTFLKQYGLENLRFELASAVF